MKNRVLILFLMIGFGLLAKQTEFKSMMDILVSRDSDYQKLLIKYEQEKMNSVLRKSVELAEVNVSYKAYKNEIDRDEFDINSEITDIQETDERYKVELSRDIFPKDFSTVSDGVSEKIAIKEISRKLEIERLKVTEKIIDDFIDWQEAEEKVLMFQDKQEILETQTDILRDLTDKNLTDSGILISYLEEYDKCLRDLNGYQETIKELSNQYEINYKDFFVAYGEYFRNADKPEIDEFSRAWETWYKGHAKYSKEVCNYIKMNKFTPYLPEMEFSLSWNWRKTDQDWSVVTPDENYTKTRDQEEIYPELAIEMSIPLDFWRNVKSKKNILKNYQKEYEIISRDLDEETSDFIQNRELKYKNIDLRLTVYSRLNELYVTKKTEEFSRIESKEGLVSKEAFDVQFKQRKASIEYQRLNYEFYREIFIYEQITRGNYENQ